MLSIWIVLKDMKLWMRDKRSILSLIVMPLILIGILGMAFSNLFGEEDSEAVSISKYPLAVVDLDQSEHSKRVVDELLSVYLVEYVDITVMELDEAEKGLAKDNIEQALIIPSGFGQDLDSGQKAEAQLITSGGSSILSTILSSGLKQYSSIVSGIEGTIEVLTEHYREHYSKLAQSGVELDPDAITQQQQINTEPVMLEKPLVEENVKGNGKTVGSFQYYAVAMGVMFLLMTVVALVSAMIGEKNEPVYDRQFTTTLRAPHYLIGKFIGIFIISMLQLTIMISGTALLFGVNWGSSIGGLLLTMLSFTISTSGLAVLVGSLIKNESLFMNIGMIGSQLLAAVGGSFVPIYLFPDWMHMIAKVIPNALALQMFLELMSGGNIGDVWQEALIASLVGLGLMLAAWVRLSRKGGVSRG